MTAAPYTSPTGTRLQVFGREKNSATLRLSYAFPVSGSTPFRERSRVLGPRLRNRISQVWIPTPMPRKGMPRGEVAVIATAVAATATVVAAAATVVELAPTSVETASSPFRRLPLLGHQPHALEAGVAEELGGASGGLDRGRRISVPERRPGKRREQVGRTFSGSGRRREACGAAFRFAALSIWVGGCSRRVGELSIWVGLLSRRVGGCSIWVGLLSIWVGGLSRRVGELSIPGGLLSRRVGRLSIPGGELSAGVSGASAGGKSASAGGCGTFAGLRDGHRRAHGRFAPAASRPAGVIGRRRRGIKG